jgi:hypothetical protein
MFVTGQTRRGAGGDVVVHLSAIEAGSSPNVWRGVPEINVEDLGRVSEALIAAMHLACPWRS